MSLNGALWLNSTTMAAQAQALGTIADNIANLNTGGYRKRSVSFSEMLGHPDKFLARSAGTKPDVTKRVEEGGSYANSESGLSAAFGGRALFPVTKDAGGTDRYYTRNGAFELRADAAGTMRLSAGDGYYLMGWPVDATTGAVSMALETITVPDRTGTLPAVASTSGALADNLPALATVGQQVVRSIPVYDAAGALHGLDMTFTNTAPNNWDVTASSTTGTLALATSPLPLAFDTTGNVTGTSSVGLSGTWSNGETATIALDFSAMTQWGEQTAVRAAQVNGSPSGYVNGYSFDSDGFLNVSYSNGAVRQVYQIPGAVFRNTNGLTEFTGNVFQASGESGAATMIDPQASNLGSFMAGMLEGSNVDLATEMTNLIRTQRAYSTAATAFRTVDEMLMTVRDLR